jgi:hypothetical protein
VSWSEVLLALCVVSSASFVRRQVSDLFTSVLGVVDGGVNSWLVAVCVARVFFCASVLGVYGFQRAEVVPRWCRVAVCT